MCLQANFNAFEFSSVEHACRNFVRLPIWLPIELPCSSPHPKENGFYYSNGLDKDHHTAGGLY